MKSFYFVKMFHKETEQTFFKFGTTKYRNVMDRFDASKYPERRCYVDFDIKHIFSVRLDDSDADEIEEYYLSKFKTINISLMTGKHYHTNNLTGLTEIRKLSNDEYLQTLVELQNFMKH